MVCSVSDIADVVVGEQKVPQRILVRTERMGLDHSRVVRGQLTDSQVGISHLVGLLVIGVGDSASVVVLDVIVRDLLEFVLLVRLEVVVQLSEYLLGFFSGFRRVAVVEESVVDQGICGAGLDQSQGLLPETFPVCPFDKVDEYDVIAFHKRAVVALDSGCNHIEVLVDECDGIELADFFEKVSQA